MGNSSKPRTSEANAEYLKGQGKACEWLGIPNSPSSHDFSLLV